MTTSQRRRIALIALLLLLIGGGVGTFGIIHLQQANTPAAAAVSTVDPRLILRPQHVPVSGTLADGSLLTGSIYPGFPSTNNTLQLTVRRQGRPVPASGRITFNVTMLGMRMLPAKGTLRPAGPRFSGPVLLPMFGSYRGQVVLTTSTGSLTGTIALALPLPAI